MRSPKQAIILLLCFSLLAGAVMGANTHLNISIQETVHQNVTFAKNFWLTENQTYLLIEGVLDITNPGTEPVFDIDLEFTNVDDLVSNIAYSSGRLGYQVRYPQSSSWAEYNAVTASWQNLDNTTAFFNISSPAETSQDIDDDGSVDTVKVNSTHVLFNLSSQYNIIAIRLTNSTGDGIDISSASATAEEIVIDNVNITSLSNGADPIQYFGTLYVNGTTNTDDTIDLMVYFNITDHSYDSVMLHIPELLSGNTTRFLYNISGSINPPLDIDTTYTHTFNRKVLAGERLGVTDTVTNILDIAVDVTDINITITAMNISWDGKEYNFTLQNLSNDAATDYTNVSEVSDKTWYWNVKGGTLGASANANITYQVQAPDNVPSSGTYLAVRQTLSYQVASAASNISLTRAWARSRINFSVTKRITQPSDNEYNRNVTWQAIPEIGARENITYTLQKVSLWVTTTLDPNEDQNLATEYLDQGEFNITKNWSGGAITPWYFNFTDGSGSAYPPPIVWIKPYWVITNAYNQILNTTFTVSGTDIYVKYIYVINGYWLEVDKNITSISDGYYKIHTWVHNRGNAWTPENMTVTVYDFIPSTFTASSFSPNYNNASNVTGEFTGTAYRWDIGLKAPMNSSLAPDDGAVGGDDEWNVTYYVTGSGDYVVSDLYIVGLDPIKVDGASASPLITVFTAVRSHTKELVYAGIVIFLILLNAVNLLMTTRINNKLDKKGHHESGLRNSIDELKKK